MDLLNGENLIDKQTDTVEYETTNYDKFKFKANNRPVERAYVAKLKNSMAEKGFVGAGIIVDENFNICDGQHRFSAARELGIPIKYIVKEGYGLDEIATLNQNGHNWTAKTFLESYAKSGRDAYIVCENIISNYRIPTSTLKHLIVVAKRKIAKTPRERQGITLSKIGNDINNGVLELLDEEKEWIIDFLDCLETFNFFKGYKTDRFIKAYSDIYIQPHYSHLQMIRKLNKLGDLLTEKRTRYDYLDLLCNDIYSKGKGEKIYYNLSRKKFEG